MNRGRSRALLLLPFIGIILLIALDLANNNPEVTLEPALTAGPALAAVVSRRPWFPIVVGALSILAAVGVAAHHGSLHRSVHTTSLFAIIVITWIGWASTVLRARQERALADARLVSEVAQRVLLRAVPERIGPVRTAVHYAAAAAHARIGGDLYEVVQTRYGVRAVIGDVRGKGLGAVETAAAVLGAFREAAHQEARLERLATWLADSLTRALRDNAHEGVEEEFVTLLLVGIRPDGVAELANCGHPAPLLMRDDAPVTALDPEVPVPPLGVLPADEVRPPVLRLPLAPGDRLLLFTDGVIEARNSDGVFYPLAERLSALPSPVQAPAEVLERIHTDVRRHVGRALADDAAMLLLQYDPADLLPPARGEVRAEQVPGAATPEVDILFRSPSRPK
jgi:serine phosphatase RsbU (regulator of sigma subunit)